MGKLILELFPFAVPRNFPLGIGLSYFLRFSNFPEVFSFVEYAELFADSCEIDTFRSFFLFSFSSFVAFHDFREIAREDIRSSCGIPEGKKHS